MELTEVRELKPIDNIIDIVKYLDEGKVLRVDQEGTPVLIRIKRGKYTATETTLDTKQETFYYNRYWQMNNYSLNALMNYTVYLDDEWKEQTNRFVIGQAVEYKPIEGFEKDIAEITRIFIDKQEEYWYSVSNDLNIYSESDLISYK